MKSVLEIAGIAIPYADAVFVGGEWLRADEGRYAIVNPATEEVAAEVALPSRAHALAAVEAAHGQGQLLWSVLPVAERAAICGRFCAALEERLDDMGRLWAVEAGMPIGYSRIFHRYGAVAAWQAALAAAAAVLADQPRSSPLGDILIRREPAGVLLAIMPYNGPLVMIGTKVLPALLAGCPVIVKAAVESQLIMRIVAQCAAQAGFPAGTISFLCGDASIGQMLAEHPHVDMVSLTGGHVAAQAVIEATRGRFARTHLELGGKSPALVLDDADIPAMLKSLVPGATNGTGQVCASLTRVLVSRGRHDEVVEAMRAAWQALPIGDPLDPATRIGPLATAAARDRTERFVERARQEGGRIVTGGQRPKAFPRGYYYEPTIVTGLSEEADLARNEVFGPVTAVLTYTDVEDGIRMANNSSFGLAASVYTRDLKLAQRCAGAIRAGSVAINRFGPSVTEPFGGVRGSGWGREAGPEGILEFTEIKQIILDREETNLRKDG
ncbi:MAG: aldehyde dehydrogenase family protein [Sphingobium sp.]